MIICTDDYCLDSKSVNFVMKRTGDNVYCLRIYPSGQMLKFDTVDERDKFYKELVNAMEKGA